MKKWKVHVADAQLDGETDSDGYSATERGETAELLCEAIQDALHELTEERGGMEELCKRTEGVPQAREEELRKLWKDCSFLLQDIRGVLLARLQSEWPGSTSFLLPSPPSSLASSPVYKEGKPKGASSDVLGEEGAQRGQRTEDEKRKEERRPAPHGTGRSSPQPEEQRKWTEEEREEQSQARREEIKATEPSSSSNKRNRNKRVSPQQGTSGTTGRAGQSSSGRHSPSSGGTLSRGSSWKSSASHSSSSFPTAATGSTWRSGGDGQGMEKSTTTSTGIERERRWRQYSLQAVTPFLCLPGRLARETALMRLLGQEQFALSSLQRRWLIYLTLLIALFVLILTALCFILPTSLADRFFPGLVAVCGCLWILLFHASVANLQLLKWTLKSFDAGFLAVHVALFAAACAGLWCFTATAYLGSLTLCVGFSLLLFLDCCPAPVRRGTVTCLTLSFLSLSSVMAAALVSSGGSWQQTCKYRLEWAPQQPSDAAAEVGSSSLGNDRGDAGALEWVWGPSLGSPGGEGRQVRFSLLEFAVNRLYTLVILVARLCGSIYRNPRLSVTLKSRVKLVEKVQEEEGEEEEEEQEEEEKREDAREKEEGQREEASGSARLEALSSSPPVVSPLLSSPAPQAIQPQASQSQYGDQDNSGGKWGRRPAKVEVVPSGEEEKEEEYLSSLSSRKKKEEEDILRTGLSSPLSTGTALSLPLQPHDPVADNSRREREETEREEEDKAPQPLFCRPFSPPSPPNKDKEEQKRERAAVEERGERKGGREDDETREGEERKREKRVSEGKLRYFQQQLFPSFQRWLISAPVFDDPQLRFSLLSIAKLLNQIQRSTARCSSFSSRKKKSQETGNISRSSQLRRQPAIAADPAREERRSSVERQTKTPATVSSSSAAKSLSSPPLSPASLPQQDERALSPSSPPLRPPFSLSKAFFLSATSASLSSLLFLSPTFAQRRLYLVAHRPNREFTEEESRMTVMKRFLGQESAIRSWLRRRKRMLATVTWFVFVFCTMSLFIGVLEHLRAANMQEEKVWLSGLAVAAFLSSCWCAVVYTGSMNYRILSSLLQTFDMRFMLLELLLFQVSSWGGLWCFSFPGLFWSAAYFVGAVIAASYDSFPAASRRQSLAFLLVALFLTAFIMFALLAAGWLEPLPGEDEDQANTTCDPRLDLARGRIVLRPNDGEEELSAWSLSIRQFAINRGVTIFILCVRLVFLAFTRPLECVMLKCRFEIFEVSPHHQSARRRSRGLSAGWRRKTELALLGEGGGEQVDGG